jgi:hypothetical protein
MPVMNPHPTLSLYLMTELNRERTRTRPTQRAKRPRSMSDHRAMFPRGRRRHHAPSWPTA